MSNLPLEFDDKVNHPELEAFFQQFGLEKYIDIYFGKGKKSMTASC